jgi:thiamine-monophosphate kinase
MLKRRFGRRAAGLVAGIGDDAAVFRPAGAGEDWIVTTDMLVEGVDFRQGWMTAADLGHKSLAVNLSDLAAMGASPRFYLAALGVPAGVSMRWIGDFFRGMTRLAGRHRAVLIGGDLSRSPAGIHVTVTAIGESCGRNIMRRSGGRAGDLLYVTGILGRAAAGLHLLFEGISRSLSPHMREALCAHKTPQPRCREGAWLARSGLVRSMMDLSDGLSADLPRLCSAGGTGAEIHAADLPLFEPARSWDVDALDCALNGGEDFELLFSVPPDCERRLQESYPRRFPPITRIGRLTHGRHVVVMSESGGRARVLQPRGFDHFRPGFRRDDTDLR